MAEKCDNCAGVTVTRAGCRGGSGTASGKKGGGHDAGIVFAWSPGVALLPCAYSSFSGLLASLPLTRAGSPDSAGFPA